MPDTEVSLSLSVDEALVLFDWLGRHIEDDNGANLQAAGARDSELWALNSLFCQLESQLGVPFAVDAPDLFAKARARIEAGRSWSDGSD